MLQILGHVALSLLALLLPLALAWHLLGRSGNEPHHDARRRRRRVDKTPS